MQKNASEGPDWVTASLPRLLVGLGISALMLAVFVIGLYAWFFRGLPVAPESDAWGQLGDFFGGVLNPAFSFLALLALLMTLYVQSRELKLSRQVAELSREELELTREELKNSAEALAAQNDAIHDQRFEQTFFSWFESYRSLVEDIHDVPRGGSRGRDALNAMHGNYMSGYAVLFKAREIGLLGYVPEGDWIQQIRKMPSEDHEAFRNAYMEAREDFFRLGYREQLRAPFATLAALLDWICSQDRFTSDKKQLYFGLVASHLSWIEGYFVFLACVGDEWPGLRRLVNESGILRKFDWRADPCMPIVWPLLESVFVRPPKWDAAVVMP